MLKSIKALLFSLLVFTFVIPSTFSMQILHELCEEHCEEHCHEENRHNLLEDFSKGKLSDTRSIVAMCCNHSDCHICALCNIQSAKLESVDLKRQIVESSSVSPKRIDVALISFVENLILADFYLKESLDSPPPFRKGLDLKSTYQATIQNICILII